MYGWKMALLLMILLLFNYAGAVPNQIETSEVNKDLCPDQDVWVIIKHLDVWHGEYAVIVHVPKYSLTNDSKNCPDKDTKVAGRVMLKNGDYYGIHVVVLGKGKLNDEKGYTTNPPPNIPAPADNIRTWNVNN